MGWRHWDGAAASTPKQWPHRRCCVDVCQLTQVEFVCLTESPNRNRSGDQALAVGQRVISGGQFADHATTPQSELIWRVGCQVLALVWIDVEMEQLLAPINRIPHILPVAIGEKLVRILRVVTRRVFTVIV